MSVISNFLQSNSSRRLKIHVIGDGMVDEYYKVKVTRISPESPNVCVMLSETDTPDALLPGGAANVCYQLRNFNVQTNLFCWTDLQADGVYQRSGLGGVWVTLPEGLKIPRKKRYFDGDVQVSDRWDVERINCGLKEDLGTYQRLVAGNLVAHLACGVDAIILSDYNKGVFANHFSFVDAIREQHRDIPIIVDPKKGPLSKWHGCTVFKPNAVEALELSGQTDWKSQCHFFKDELWCDAVIITQSGNGVVGLADRFFEYRPAHSVNATKIMGAGDCFIGILALAIGHGFSIEDAAALAFEAGALYVQNNSYQPITPWQLQKQSKFVSPDELVSRNYKLVFANGCFDILHSGHLESLRFAKSKGDRLVVAVNSDASVSRLKGPKRPVVPLSERMEMLAALECVDYVVSFEDDSPQDLIERIVPDVLIKGEDWKNKPVAGTDVVKEIYFVPLVEDKSTTNIIEKIKTLM
jgi:D-beta-D-heptose 7-phosphate kinase/D-beta-D-heptose 1-phosphate adenosyltransferase